MSLQTAGPDQASRPARLGRAVLLAAPILLAILPQAAYAQASDTTPTGPIVSGIRATKCADDLGDSAKNDTPVVISDCNGSPEQDWTVSADGTLQLNGKCMDIFRNDRANGTKVELFTCNGGKNQQWNADSGQLVNPASGKCLDDPKWSTANGTQLIIYTCTGKRNQQWQLPSAPSARSARTR
jgi:hypothetical protein